MNEYEISAVITAVIGAILAVAGLIIKRSKTKTDDKIFWIIKNILGRK